MGDSQGGAQAIHLAVLLQEGNPEIEVKALVLYWLLGITVPKQAVKSFVENLARYVDK
jgi:hypothetical protein